VGPDALVGVAMERSLELMVALLGVLKAGGAYVALDPAYPRERLAAMLDDARPAVGLPQRHVRARLPLDTEDESEGDRGASVVLVLDAGWDGTDLDHAGD